MDSAYKLAYLSYAVFAILVYLFTASHYVHRYVPETSALPESRSDFYKVADISEREQDIISLLIEGSSNKDIS